ncbi:hypothetical protein V6N13_149562 [Hibiscus sabdariffa]
MSDAKTAGGSGVGLDPVDGSPMCVDVVADSVEIAINEDFVTSDLCNGPANNAQISPPPKLKTPPHPALTAFETPTTENLATPFKN